MFGSYRRTVARAPGEKEGDMPFVYDETEVEWPEDDSDPPPPRADQFVYIPPPQFGGAPEPVRFSVASVIAAAESSEPQQPPSSSEEERRRWQERQRREHEQRRERLFATVIPELRKIGARRAHYRYDGGNDEGFSWLESVEMQDGGRINAGALTQRLLDIRLLDKLNAANVIGARRDSRPDQEELDLVLLWLCDEWATMLLGRGYGTGEYSMYGAFTVDLEACTIADDRNADPIVNNIRISE
jgi:hypothetical protein